MKLEPEYKPNGKFVHGSKHIICVCNTEAQATLIAHALNFLTYTAANAVSEIHLIDALKT